jgi:hypothetical protein
MLTCCSTKFDGIGEEEIAALMKSKKKLKTPRKGMALSQGCFREAVMKVSPEPLLLYLLLHPCPISLSNLDLDND